MEKVEETQWNQKFSLFFFGVLLCLFLTAVEQSGKLL